MAVTALFSQFVFAVLSGGLAGMTNLLALLLGVVI